MKCIEILDKNMDLKFFINQLYFIGLDKILDSVWNIEKIETNGGNFTNKAQEIQNKNELYINGKKFFNIFVNSEEDFNTVFFENSFFQIRFGIFDSTFLFFCSKDTDLLKKISNLYTKVEYCNNLPDYLRIESEKIN